MEMYLKHYLISLDMNICLKFYASMKSIFGQTSPLSIDLHESIFKLEMKGVDYTAPDIDE